MLKITIHLATKLVLTLTLVSAIESIQAKENQIQQNSSGFCNPNTIVTGSEKGITSTYSYCPTTINYYDKSLKKLNKLEEAQYQLLLAKNKAEISAKKLSFKQQMNESFYSLWLELKNSSEIEVSNLKVSLLSSQNTTSNSSAQTYMSDELPDSIINSPNLTLDNNTRLLLKVATSAQLKSFTPLPTNDWCLYDVSERANDIDIEGYVDAQFKLLKSLESNFSQVNSVPIAFEVSYQDVFHRKIVFPVVQYLRFANISSSNYVFYPSKLKYEKLECIHL